MAKPGAVLTPSQREYLRGESDIESQTDRERMTRARIRERIRAAIADFSLLLEATDPDELHQALDLIEQKEAHLEEGVAGGLIDGVAFMFAANAAAYRGNEITDSDMYGPLIAEGIRRACRHADIAVDRVGVDIEIEGVAPLEEFDIADLADMPLSALRQRYLAGLISEEQFDRALDAKVDARVSNAEE